MRKNDPVIRPGKGNSPDVTGAGQYLMVNLNVVKTGAF
jgi:hypothetical protein